MTDIHAIVPKLTSGRIHSLLSFGLLTRQDTSLGQLQDAPPVLKKQLTETLISDLQADLISRAGGPLSFERLSGLSVAELHGLEGQTVLEVLKTAETSRRVLESLVEYGRVLASDRFPLTTQLTGIVITALASAALSRRHGGSAGAEGIAHCATTLQSLVDIAAIPQPLRDAANEMGRMLSESQT
jgi:hypothetical protein